MHMTPGGKIRIKFVYIATLRMLSLGGSNGVRSYKEFIASMNDFRSVVEAHVKAIEERDLPAFSEFLHPSQSSIIILPNGQMIEGYDSVLNFHKEWFEDLDWRMDIAIMDVFAVGSMGYALLDVVYHDVDQDGNPYELTYFLSLLFVKVDEKWILLRDQNTVKE